MGFAMLNPSYGGVSVVLESPQSCHIGLLGRAERMLMAMAGAPTRAPKPHS